MNSSPASVVGTLDKLSIGVSRVSIRHGSTATRYKKKNYAWTGFKRGHGEHIYVFTHSQTGMIIYSHESSFKFDSQKALSQIPYTVKKQKPAIIRPDYWEALCMIKFGPGQGAVGRNVFQKLREFRQLHELSWGWQAAELKQLTRRERGQKIHNQKPNAIADIAAVLSGVGRGNLMWTTEPAPAPEKLAIEAPEAEGEAEGKEAVVKDTSVSNETPAPETAKTAAAVENQASSEADAPAEAAVAEATQTPKSVGPEKRLLNADIYWANDVDVNWARSWTDNVTHHVGLPKGWRVWNWRTKRLVDPDIKEEAEEANEAAEGEGDKTAEGEASAKDAEGKEEGAEDKKGETESKDEPKQEKKGWLGWLGGKSGNPSQDARI